MSRLPRYIASEVTALSDAAQGPLPAAAAARARGARRAARARRNVSGLGDNADVDAPLVRVEHPRPPWTRPTPHEEKLVGPYCTMCPHGYTAWVMDLWMLDGHRTIHMRPFLALRPPGIPWLHPVAQTLDMWPYGGTLMRLPFCEDCAPKWTALSEGQCPTRWRNRNTESYCHTADVQAVQTRRAPQDGAWRAVLFGDDCDDDYRKLTSAAWSAWDRSYRAVWLWIAPAPKPKAKPAPAPPEPSGRVLSFRRGGPAS